MKILYLECTMGIAGDMLMSALWDLVENKKSVLKEINTLSLPYTDIGFDRVTSCSISGYRAEVIIDGQQEGDIKTHNPHRNLGTVNDIIDNLSVSEKVKTVSKKVYKIIAAAESKVHNQPVEQVHFHEVGMLDAIADVVICNFLIDKLQIDRIIVSPINVGNGTVRCAHGVLPVPAPATADILTSVPYYKSDIQSELCTPTGAALVKYHADTFGNMPSMAVHKVGYGFGKKEFETANCVRAFIGQSNDLSDKITELACNIDDMTGEEIAYAADLLMKNGAVDVTTQPVFMKKGRCGVILRALCREENKKNIIELIFRHTSTIGIREYICERFILDRDVKTVSTPLGDVRVKYSSGYHCDKVKIESDDIISIAEQTGKSIFEIKKIIKSCLN